MSLLTRPTRETDEVITCFRDGEVTLRSNRREDGFTISMTETVERCVTKVILSFTEWTGLLVPLEFQILAVKLHLY